MRFTQKVQPNAFLSRWALGRQVPDYASHSTLKGLHWHYTAQELRHQVCQCFYSSAVEIPFKPRRSPCLPRLPPPACLETRGIDDLVLLGGRGRDWGEKGLTEEKLNWHALCKALDFLLSRNIWHNKEMPGILNILKYALNVKKNNGTLWTQANLSSVHLPICNTYLTC